MKLKEAFAVAKASGLELFLAKQIATDQLLEKLVPVQLADEISGIVIVGDIGGVFGQKIADNLIDGVISFFVESIEYTAEGSAHILLVLTGNGEFNGAVRHDNRPPNRRICILYPKNIIL